VIAEALAALYDVATKCAVCREHVATRHDGHAMACDRVACGDGITHETWRDLPHAAVLRAANAAREAMAAP
jgi:hypothetical protein